MEINSSLPGRINPNHSVTWHSHSPSAEAIGSPFGAPKHIILFAYGRVSLSVCRHFQFKCNTIHSTPSSVHLLSSVSLLMLLLFKTKVISFPNSGRRRWWVAVTEIGTRVSFHSIMPPLITTLAFTIKEVTIKPLQTNQRTNETPVCVGWAADEDDLGMATANKTSIIRLFIVFPPTLFLCNPFTGAKAQAVNCYQIRVSCELHVQF